MLSPGLDIDTAGQTRFYRPYIRSTQNSRLDQYSSPINSEQVNGVVSGVGVGGVAVEVGVDGTVNVQEL